jgi:hypothetical protein
LISFFSSIENKFIKLGGIIDNSPSVLTGSDFRIKYLDVIEIPCLATARLIPNFSAKFFIISSISII